MDSGLAAEPVIGPRDFARARWRQSGMTAYTQGRAALAFASKLSILPRFCMVTPISSRPLSSACLRCGSMSNLTTPPSGPRISCFSRSTISVVEQLLEVFRRHLDRQHAVLKAVVVENIAERCRDHAGDAEIEKRPRRVLARGAAAEIVAGDQNLGLAIGRLVEHEIRVLAAVVAKALLGEQALAEPGALDGLQILFGNDHVGVDIDHL